MSILTITNNRESFEIKGKDIINLEIKLNITDYGKPWVIIGDHLYNFYNLRGCEKQPSNILNVKDFQYTFLQDLKNKSYNQVYKEQFGKQINK
jgi:hypothetical protein